MLIPEFCQVYLNFLEGSIKKRILFIMKDWAVSTVGKKFPFLQAHKNFFNIQPFLPLYSVKHHSSLQATKLTLTPGNILNIFLEFILFSLNNCLAEYQLAWQGVPTIYFICTLIMIGTLHNTVSARIPLSVMINEKLLSLDPQKRPKLLDNLTNRCL